MFTQKKTKRNNRSLQMEQLEAREVFSFGPFGGLGCLPGSFTPAAIDTSTWIEGTGLHDRITIKAHGKNAVAVTIQSYKNPAYMNNSLFKTQHLNLTNNQDFYGKLRVNGHNGNDTIDVWSNVNFDTLIKGGNGNDVIYGGKGNDEIHGGRGNDRIHGHRGNDTIYGDRGHDKIYGGSGDDVLKGGFGNDTIKGENGNDVIHGGTGHDRLYGGRHNDTIYGDPDQPYSDAQLQLAKKLGKKPADLWPAKFTIYGNDYIEGGSGEDHLYGGADNDTIKGGGDNDVIKGNSGNDNIWGGSGNDVIEGGNGHDKLYGDSGADEIRGGIGNDLIKGGSNFRVGALWDDLKDWDKALDDLFGKNKDSDLSEKAKLQKVATLPTNVDDFDLLFGDAGDDTIHGDSGRDWIDGGIGNDNLYGDQGRDVLLGGAGNDNIWGGSGNDYIAGGENNDTLNGDSGKDVIYGNDGDDKLNGGAQPDYLIGGYGSDKLWGGAEPPRGRKDVMWGDEPLVGGSYADTFYKGWWDKIEDKGGKDTVKNWRWYWGSPF